MKAKLAHEARVAIIVRDNLSRGYDALKAGAGFISSVAMVQQGPTRSRGTKGDTLYHQRDATRIATESLTPEQLEAVRHTKRYKEQKRKEAARQEQRRIAVDRLNKER